LEELWEELLEELELSKNLCSATSSIFHVCQLSILVNEYTTHFFEAERLMILVRAHPIAMIREKNKGSIMYIPREKEGMRVQVKNEKKGTAARYYQLMTGHAVIAPYLKNKLRKRESEECWWCQEGKRQSREHLFKECSK
jgi:hypothetical protein